MASEIKSHPLFNPFLMTCDRINRQYSIVQRIPRIHNFESGPMTQSPLTNLADRWWNRNTWYVGQGVMQDTVTPEYID
ncbi:hypothetical protein JCGZ_20219 [Jatropha curcas]|uniref:Uncharacterized protein n=1 Tax=Jatropha curcas TaxID=180498 RepID=A0A067K557_JATCU|nr:hypothetical protein JCGZ_20219 [Jatropha curcas]